VNQSLSECLGKYQDAAADTREIDTDLMHEGILDQQSHFSSHWCQWVTSLRWILELTCARNICGS
jgi:meiotically up-regulated gene 157 (Mug157) protein